MGRVSASFFSRRGLVQVFILFNQARAAQGGNTAVLAYRIEKVWNAGILSVIKQRRMIFR
jgi:hypothetical protein